MTGKVGGGVDEGGIGGSEDSRRALNGGERRGMTTGKRSEEEVTGRLPHPGGGKLKGGLERQMGQGEPGERRSGATPTASPPLQRKRFFSDFYLRPAGGRNPAVCSLDAHATEALH